MAKEDIFFLIIIIAILVFTFCLIDFAKSEKDMCGYYCPF